MWHFRNVDVVRYFTQFQLFKFFFQNALEFIFSCFNRLIIFLHRIYASTTIYICILLYLLQKLFMQTLFNKQNFVITRWLVIVLCLLLFPLSVQNLLKGQHLLITTLTRIGYHYEKKTSRYSSFCVNNKNSYYLLIQS